MLTTKEKIRMMEEQLKDALHNVSKSIENEHLEDYISDSEYDESNNL